MPQISVPFLWEEKPGLPKEERTLDSLLPPPSPQPLSSPPLPPPPISSMPEKSGSITPPPQPLPYPAKFVVSIPFKWEEKPGTPLQSFTRRPSLTAEDKSLPLPPSYYQFFECFESDQESPFGDDDDQQEQPSLLANRLVPVSAISSAIPFDNTQHTEVMEIEAERGSSTSSYETGNSLLEVCSDFEMSGIQENETRIKALPGEGEHSTAIRRLPTLGELIMLSRRRSYESVSKVFEEPSDLGCCMFGTGNGGALAKLLSEKSLLALKFA